eukprot:TRINITY_DN2617_c0_g2_i1.p1 TRINITY_DN2617_c0_g2~~TRINITY_DN2617_c0_g2_i1.p1  ORF type:complete len:227 (+),score=22.42 TRINITY_DN2617_c0_g2_i1:139-819(+)
MGIRVRLRGQLRWLGLEGISAWFIHCYRGGLGQAPGPGSGRQYGAIGEQKDLTMFPPKKTMAIDSFMGLTGDTFWKTHISEDSDQAHIKTERKLRAYFEKHTHQSARTLSNEDFRSIETALKVTRGTVYRAEFIHFWPWFTAATNIIARCIDLWTKNIIYGLIAKDEAHRLLSTEEDGVFLIRFSESRKSNVALAYKDSTYVTHTLVEITPAGFEIEVENSEKLTL